MSRRGFSLLEILLSLAILGGTLAILSQIVGTGGDASRAAHDLAMARLICQSKLSEILVSKIAPVAVAPTLIGAPDSGATSLFYHTVEVAPAGMQNMLAIRVSVEARDAEGRPGEKFTLTRLIIDPALGLEQAQVDADAAKAKAAEEKAAASANASTSTAAGSGAATGAGGGNQAGGN